MSITNLLKLFIVIACLCFNTCSSCCECKDEIDELKQLVLKVINNTQPLPSTCAEVASRDSNAKSGYYTLVDQKGQKQHVFCQMGSIPDSGCGDGAWRRVAFFDRETSECPKGLPEYTFDGKKTCSNTGGKCDVIEFFVGQSYTRVCGRVQGYGDNTPDAFQPGGTRGIDSVYVDGIGITYGSSSKLSHLWTYAATKNSDSRVYGCPCSVSPQGFIPSFVGDNYYCEGGAKLGSEDVLWDGKLCHSNEKEKCCRRPNQPWFEREIDATSDPIQLRLCADQGLEDERVLVFQYELYVQ